MHESSHGTDSALQTQGCSLKHLFCLINKSQCLLSPPATLAVPFLAQVSQLPANRALLCLTDNAEAHRKTGSADLPPATAGARQARQAPGGLHMGCLPQATSLG